jgi:hypothetical protein
MKLSYFIKQEVPQFFRHHFEQLFWLTALLSLYYMQANSGDQSLCILSRFNIHSCPGCGLGHSIHDALHLQLADSFHHHPWGIAAVIIIINRIKQLSLKPKLLLR